MSTTITVDDLAHERRIVDKWQGSTTQELFSLTTLELTVGSVWQISQENMLDTNTLETFDTVSTCLDHTSYLTIFSFGEDDGKSIGADTFYFTGIGLDKFCDAACHIFSHIFRSTWY